MHHVYELNTFKVRCIESPNNAYLLTSLLLIMSFSINKMLQYDTNFIKYSPYPMKNSGITKHLYKIKLQVTFI